MFSELRPQRPRRIGFDLCAAEGEKPQDVIAARNFPRQDAATQIPINGRLVLPPPLTRLAPGSRTARRRFTRNRSRNDRYGREDHT